MAYYNFTRVKCSNPEVVKAIAKKIGYEGIVDKVCWHGREFQVSTQDRVPHDEVKKISKQFPNEVITCRYSSTDDLYYTEVQVVEYKAGQDNVVNLEVEYFFLINPFYRGQFLMMSFYDDPGTLRLIDKVKAFFRKIDTTETDEEGNLFINRCDEEVTYKFEHDINPSKKYMMEATKRGHLIRLNVFKELVENN